MITERDTPVVRPLMRWLIRRFLIQSAVERSFHAVRLRTVAPLAADPDPVGPIRMVISNHATWWDAYLWDIVNMRTLRLDPVVMAEEKTVRDYGFFRWLGVFGVDRENPRAAVDAMRHAVARALATPRAGVFLFPQGKFRPFEARPLDFYHGAGRIAAALIAARGTVIVHPLAMRLSFLDAQKPEAWLRAGASLTLTRDDADAGNSKALTARMEAALTAEVDALAGDLLARREADYAVLLRGAPGIQEGWDAVRGA